MAAGFLPPVVFTITANATQAMAAFKGINTQLKIMDAQAKKTTVTMLAMNKVILASTAAAKALGIATLGFAALGVKEIGDLQVAYNRLGMTMAAVGVSTEENRTRAADLAQSYEKLGFDAAHASDALSILLQSTKNLDTSQKLLNVSADLARARTMDLSTAARLVARAQGGNTRIFSMFGIQLDKTKSKTEATKEAFEKLSQVIGGQAQAYTKTFQGQLAVLGKQIENVAEGIGAVLLPYLQKFISIISESGKFVSKYKGVLNTLAVLITTVVIVAVVNLTKRLFTLTAAWAAANAPILAVVAAVVAAAAAFVYFWNKSEGVRKAVIGLGKLFLEFAESVVMGFQLALNVLLLLVRGTANAQIALGKLFRDEEMVKRGKKTLDWIDETNKSIEDFGNKIDKAQGNLDKFTKTKIDLSKFKLPSLKIAEFANGESMGDNIASDIAAGLTKAQQKIKDFNREIAAEFKSAVTKWSSIVSRDFAAEIDKKLAQGLDKTIYDAQAAVEAYQAASNKYEKSLAKLTKAQEAYRKAVNSGDEAAIASAESTLKAAEDTAQGIVNAMSSALDQILSIQDTMISQVVDLRTELAKLENDRTLTLAAAQNKREILEKKYYADVKKIRDQYDLDVRKAEEDAARRSREIVKQSIDQMRGIFKSATYRSLTDIYSGITYEGRYLKGGTAAKIIKNLGLQASKAKLLANDAAALAANGFSQTFIEEVIALGPDMGHSLAQTILTSSPESIAQLQSYWQELQRQSSHGIDNIAKSLNSGITLATEELTQQLADVQTELNASLAALQADLNNSLLDAWNAYADALDDINNETAATVAAIDAQITQVKTSIAALQAALGAVATMTTPGVVGQAPNVTGAAFAAAQQAATQTESTMRLENAINEFIAAQTNLAEANLVVNVTANTDAKPQEIADDVGWAIRTSGDVQFRTRNVRRIAQ